MCNVSPKIVIALFSRRLEVLANRQYQLKQMIHGKQGGFFGGGKQTAVTGSPKVHNNNLFDDGKHSPKAHSPKHFEEEKDDCCK